MISPKNKLRLCLISVLILTLFGGAVYYWYALNHPSELGQGTLITVIDMSW